MKRTNVVCIFVTIFSLFVYAQEPLNVHSSQLVLNTSAKVLPHFSVSANVGSSLFLSRNGFFRGMVLVALADVAELSVMNDAVFINALGSIQSGTGWELKLRLLPPTEDQPAVAVRIRNSLQWISDQLWSTDIETYSQTLSRRGLWNSHYDVQLTTMQVVISHRLIYGVELHTGFGAQEVQTRNLWIIAAPAPSIGNGSHAPDPVQETLLSGFLSLVIPLDSKLCLLSEIQSFPSVFPNIDQTKLDVNRAYLGSVALRYQILKEVAVDGGFIFQRNPYVRDNVETRVGLSTLLNFQ